MASSTTRTDNTKYRQLYIYTDSHHYGQNSFVGTGTKENIGEFLAKGAKPIIMLYQQRFLDDGDLVFNETDFRALVDLAVPFNYNGYVQIDWEGTYLEDLRNSPKNADYYVAVTQFLTALRIGKSMRPNAKWSYYSFPILRWWDLAGTSTDWNTATSEQKDWAIALAKQPEFDLYNECDYLSPSIYDHYNNEFSASDESWWADKNQKLIQLSVEMAKGRPVIPSISHRNYFDNSHPWILIPESEVVTDQIDLSFNYGATGVVWWSGDYFYYRNASEQNGTGFRSIAEFSDLTIDNLIEAQPYLEKLHRRYFSKFISVIKNVPL